jgi:hypothetical protein
LMTEGAGKRKVQKVVIAFNKCGTKPVHVNVLNKAITQPRVVKQGQSVLHEGAEFNCVVLDSEVHQILIDSQRDDLRVVLTDPMANPAIRGKAVAAQVIEEAQAADLMYKEGKRGRVVGSVGAHAADVLRAEDYDVLTMYTADQIPMFKMPGEAPKPQAWNTADGVAMVATGRWYDKDRAQISIIHSVVARPQLESLVRAIQASKYTVAAVLIVPAGTVFELSDMEELDPRVMIPPKQLVDMGDGTRKKGDWVLTVLVRKEWQSIFGLMKDIDYTGAADPAFLYMPEWREAYLAARRAEWEDDQWELDGGGNITPPVSKSKKVADESEEDDDEDEESPAPQLSQTKPSLKRPPLCNAGVDITQDIPYLDLATLKLVEQHFNEYTSDAVRMAVGMRRAVIAREAAGAKRLKVR